MMTPVIPPFRRQRQENHMAEGYIARPCLKKTKRKKEKENNSICNSINRIK
jgi:hypothetical protein